MEKIKKIDKKAWLAMILILIVIIIAFIINIIQKEKLKNTFEVWAEQMAGEIQEEKEEVTPEENTEISIEELEKEEEDPGEKNIPSNKDKAPINNGVPYYIKVNYGAQVVTIYGLDENKKYTKPVKAMVCSTGVATPTSGVYKIPARWKWLGLQGDVYGQYATQIKGNILFHSVPYLERGKPDTLEYWEYDKLGTYASAGCIRLTVADALWIYNNCAKGTQVEFYSSSEPGPLGKPTAKKISSAPQNLRNWDPTDPDSSNPWKTYKAEDKPSNDKPSEDKQNKQNMQTNSQTNTQNNSQIPENKQNVQTNKQTNIQSNIQINSQIGENKNNPMTSEIK